MTLSIIVRLLGASAVAALFAGTLLTAQPAKAGVVLMHPAHVVNPFKNPTCRHHGGARVDPCTLDFNATNPGPFLVTTFNAKGKKATFSEADTCGGIASVVSQGSDQWLVSAESFGGTCAATFTMSNSHGKVTGTAVLNITSEL